MSFVATTGVEVSSVDVGRGLASAVDGWMGAAVKLVTSEVGFVSAVGGCEVSFLDRLDLTELVLQIPSFKSTVNMHSHN